MTGRRWSQWKGGGMRSLQAFFKGQIFLYAYSLFLIHHEHVASATCSRHHDALPYHGPRINGAKHYGLKSLKP
jgi:hypothetical protein